MATSQFLSDWQGAGFSAPPVFHISNGNEEVARAFSQSPFYAGKERHGSLLWGGCFFAFSTASTRIGVGRIDRAAIANLDVYILEDELNAALWNNTYQKIALFNMPQGIGYWLGYVGMNIRTTERVFDNGKESKIPGQMKYNKPSKRRMMQITLADQSHVGKLTLIGQYSVRDAYRYIGARSRSWN